MVNELSILRSTRIGAYWRPASSTAISTNLIWLKLIAMVAMVFDHVAVLLLEHGYLQDAMWRAPGRVSIPIFAFLVAWGYEKYSSDRVRYALRLWVFALISEPVYFAFFGHFGNAILPLALGVTLLLCADSVRSLWSWGWVAMVGFLIEFYMMLDQSLAILLTVVLVVGFDRLIRTGGRAVWWLAVIAVCMLMMNEVRAGYVVLIPVSLGLIWLSVRVEMNLPELKVGRWLGYVFYPAHLAVLWLADGWL